MRILVVNPNTSLGVTRRIDLAAQAAIQPGEVVQTVPAAFGPDLIVSPADSALAMQGVLAAVERYHHGMDAIVLASFGDTGLDQVRALTSKPVVGIADAALRRALEHGPRFSIVSFSPSVKGSLRAIVEHYGLLDHLADVTVLQDGIWTDPGNIHKELAEPLLHLCQQRAKAGGIDSIVLGGGPLAGLAANFAPQVKLPLVDGTTAAIEIARRMVAKAQDVGNP
ncbi:aspartate/glutamate racemase family protein [Roseinatronobacter sp.]|uniref:aspartate/glutamate racemase family protein n=1 Tax=Roseinatronobacter sp. TaxID=1945755 RepID=UPI0025CF6FF9|nr:aspartate/glutamate racemase family protein [Rhodobaca sp.]